MPKPEPPEVPKTKVRWIKAINAHKLGDIEDVSTARVQNLLNAGLIELYPPKATPRSEPKPKPDEKKEDEKPVVETADARPALSRKSPKAKK